MHKLLARMVLHLGCERPALIFSWIEAPDPFQTKIFFPESSTNTSPWFIDDHAMSTSVITGLEPPATLKSFASWAFVSALARPDSMPPFLIMIPVRKLILEARRLETLNLAVLNR